MSSREVIFLGTASQVPTRRRNHNALFLAWDDLGILFDPGEGTQRQMTHAGLSATQITHVCVTHFHGDHCLGLAGIVQRLSLDRVPHPVEVIYPRGGQVYFERLRHASIFHDAGVRRLICAERPDVVISVLQAVNALLARTAARAEVVLTDWHNVHRYWVAPGVRHYTAPTESARGDLVRFGAADDQVDVVGIPVRSQFTHMGPVRRRGGAVRVPGPRRDSMDRRTGGQRARLARRQLGRRQH